MVKEIQLTQGKVALVDDADFEWLSQWNWCALRQRGNNRWYAVRGRNPLIYMHRLILNPPEGYESDHIDGGGLNNRRSNLRICTCSQNHMNRHRAWGSSIYKGVYYYKRYMKWGARIQINRKQLHLGYFNSEIEAAKAYNKAAIKYYGEFARINEA